MTVRSDVLVIDQRAYAAGTGVDLATVPAGERWLIKDVNVRNTSGVATGFRLAVLRTGVGGAFFERNVPATSTETAAARFVVADEGDVIRATAGVAVTAIVFLCGARLDL